MGNSTQLSAPGAAGIGSPTGDLAGQGGRGPVHGSGAQGVGGHETAGSAAGSAATGLPWLDRALLAGVVLVTCMVSLPRFHALMLSANERDARQALGLMAQLLGQEAPDQTRTLSELVAAPGLAHRLVDLRVQDGGEVAHYHGYGLQLVQDEHGILVLAWPLEADRTGRVAFARRPGGPLLRSSDWDQLGLPPRAAVPPLQGSSETAAVAGALDPYEGPWR